MTIAYIKSNTKRRLLLVLVVLFIWIILPIQAVFDLFAGGWSHVKWRIMAELTGGGDGFWKSVIECWKSPASKR